MACPKNHENVAGKFKGLEASQAGGCAYDRWVQRMRRDGAAIDAPDVRGL